MFICPKCKHEYEDQAYGFYPACRGGFRKMCKMCTSTQRAIYYREVVKARNAAKVKQ